MQYRGVRRDFGLGPTHDVSLADARTMAMELRKMVRAGLDPVVERGLRRSSAPTFEAVARLCYDALRGGWKDNRHASWMACFEKHVFPTIGAKRVDAVESRMVVEILEPIWLTIPTTARKLLQRIGAVLDYAYVKGLIPSEISLRSVTRGLPRQNVITKHRAAMLHGEVPAFMARLTKLPNSLGRDALKLTILTAVRSNEARKAIWGEFDLETAVWSIPGTRMKTKDPHVIPLSQPAVTLLRRLRDEQIEISGAVTACDMLFTFCGKQSISDTTMLKVIRDMEIRETTVHGFRSSFTDWVAEATDFPKEVADKALAHKVSNAVEAAYRRTDFFDKRRVLMELWGAFVMDVKRA